MKIKNGLRAVFCCLAFGISFSGTLAFAATPINSSPTIINDWVNPGLIHGFNPQPEPPGDRLSRLYVISNSVFVKPGDAQGFNPQPEPPGDMPPSMQISY